MIIVLFLFLLVSVQSKRDEHYPFSGANDKNSFDKTTLLQTTIQESSRRGLQLFGVPVDRGDSVEVLCDKFEEASGTPIKCTCTSVDGGGVSVSCQEVFGLCTANNIYCYNTTSNYALNSDYLVSSLETCTDYSSTNLTFLEGSTTTVVNYTSLVDTCVTIVPTTPGDFTQVGSCSARMNGDDCLPCEICDDNADILAISFDCCNTVDGDQVKVTCGQVGGGGAFIPFFDTIENNMPAECTSGGAIPSIGRVLIGVGVLVASVLFLGVVS